MRHRITALLIAAICIGWNVLAAAADAPADGPKTVMATPGKLLLSDDFAQGLPKTWKGAKGKWESADGGVKGTELKEEMHGAAARHPIAFQDAIVQYSFKIDGAKVTSLSINDPTGHLCRLVINATGYLINKDDHDHDGPDKAARLDAVKAAIKPGVWHMATVELVGNEMVARIDDLPAAVGANDAIKAKKSNIGLTVAGESAVFKDLKVWEATAKPDWETVKAGLKK